MFESINGECQPIFALEKALECLHFTTRKYKLFGLKKQKADPKGEFFGRISVIFFVSSDLLKGPESLKERPTFHLGPRSVA